MDPREQRKWLREIPSVEETIHRIRLRGDTDSEIPRFIIIQAIQEVFQHTRETILNGTLKEPIDSESFGQQLETEVTEKIRYLMKMKLQRVVNATGVILHTNMGRALLPGDAVRALTEVAGSYSNLELDLHTGKRGHRYRYAEELICQITGAESAVVVNNNAAAVLLALQALAKDREGVISRGQLVEIGGSFRVPEVMAQSGVRMVEVGTTNKTKASDYRNAIGENTALLIKVHTSNFRVVGFTEEVLLSELVQIGQETGIPVLDDVGSGCLVDLTRWGLPKEPTVQESVQAGADIVTFSADKLLGGPQAGIIVGKKKYVDGMKKHPLLRALRLDKLTLAALESVLSLYLDNDHVEKHIPVLSMLTEDADAMRKKAESLADEIRPVWNDAGVIEVICDSSQAGGGSLPETDIPTFVVALTHNCWTAEKVASLLRQSTPSILARIDHDRVLMDPRTLRDGDSTEIAAAIKKILNHPDEGGDSK